MKNKIYIMSLISILTIILSISEVKAYGLYFSNNSDACYLSGSSGSTYFKKTSGTINGNVETKDSRIVYCYDANDAFPASNSEVSWDECSPLSLNEADKEKLKYSIANGLSSIRGSLGSCSSCHNIANLSEDQKKESCYNFYQYYRTQIAVWKYSDSSDSSSHSNEYNDLIADAEAYYEDLVKKQGKTIKLETYNNYMSLDDEDKYYVSELITVNSTYDGEMNIDLKDAEAYNTKNEKITKIKNGEKFYVKTSGNRKTDVTVKVYYTYKSYGGTVYLCSTSNDSVQNLIDYNPKTNNNEIFGRLTLSVGHKCKYKETKSGNLTCGKNKEYENNCNVLTVSGSYSESKDKIYKYTIDIELNQKGVISSTLTPSSSIEQGNDTPLSGNGSTYSGGGFKFNIIYNNKISWKLYDGSDSMRKCYIVNSKKEKTSDNCGNKTYESLVEDYLLTKRIYKMDIYKDKIKLSDNSVKFGDKLFTKPFAKECFGSDKFENQQLNTTCIFTLPEAEMNKYDGKIKTYNSNTINVNNKYYTPITYKGKYNDKGKYNIEASIEGLSRLNETKSKIDTYSSDKNWLGNMKWEDKFNNCSITLYPLLKEKKDTTITNKFIYRPIELNNPFPDRNAGFNWYDWISEPRNQERLKNSYNNNKLQYSIAMDNSKIYEIRKYNASQENYLKWNFEGDKSVFVNEYFDISRKNIVGDN